MYGEKSSIMSSLIPYSHEVYGLSTPRTSSFFRKATRLKNNLELLKAKSLVAGYSIEDFKLEATVASVVTRWQGLFHVYKIVNEIYALKIPLFLPT